MFVQSPAPGTIDFKFIIFHLICTVIFPADGTTAHLKTPSFIQHQVERKTNVSQLKLGLEFTSFVAVLIVIVVLTPCLSFFIFHSSKTPGTYDSLS